MSKKDGTLLVELERILEAMTVCEQFIHYWRRIDAPSPSHDTLRLVREMHKDFGEKRLKLIKKIIND